MSEKKINSKLHDFKSLHYTGDNMTVAVMAKASLDDLEAMVREAFGDVPRHHRSRTGRRKKPKTKRWGRPFEPRSFHRLFRVNTVQDVFQVELIWCLPFLRDAFEEEPLNYLTWCLGHEGGDLLITMAGGVFFLPSQQFLTGFLFHLRRSRQVLELYRLLLLLGWWWLWEGAVCMSPFTLRYFGTITLLWGGIHQKIAK